MAPVNFSWVISGKLAGSAMPGGNESAASGLWNDIEFLSGQGIRMLVSLERPAGPVKKVCDSLSVAWHHFPIPDFGIPEDKHAFAGLVAACVTALHEDVPVCVHCRAGIGRTGMVLACIVGSYMQLDADTAIRYVRTTRAAVEGVGQRTFISEFLDKESSTA